MCIDLFLYIFISACLLKCAASVPQKLNDFFSVTFNAAWSPLRAWTNWWSNPASGANTPHGRYSVCSGFCMTFASFHCYFASLCSHPVSSRAHFAYLCSFFQGFLGFFFWSLIVHLNKMPSTSVDTCIRQISGCPPSSRTDGLIN